MTVRTQQMENITLVPLDKHIALTSCEDVRSICAPLWNSLNTKYFNYVRRFIDGSQFCLTTDAQWTSVFLKEKLYTLAGSDKGNVGCIESGRQIKILPWTIFDSTISSMQKSISGISVGITIAIIYPKYTDFYFFGTQSHETWMSEFYLCNTELLLRFCSYFREQAIDLLQLSKKNENLIFLPKTFLQKADSGSLRIDAFIEETQIKKYTVDAPNGLVSISKKEMQCIELLCQGSSVREAAEQLCLSKRTIETHTDNVKNKLSLSTKSGLIKVFLNHLYGIPDQPTSL